MLRALMLHKSELIMKLHDLGSVEFEFCGNNTTPT